MEGTMVWLLAVTCGLAMIAIMVVDEVVGAFSSANGK